MNTNSRGEVNANANEDSQVSISSSKSKSCKAIPELLPKCDAKCLVPLCEFDYDLLVIGAGVAGLAAAIEANEHGARVAIVNCVEATPLGTRWSIGGTCINVGSIPKKLFHVAALLGEHLTESEFYGWNVPQKKVNWTKLKNGVQKHIKDTNLAIKLELFERKIDYYYAKASFKDPHTVETIRKGRTKLLKGKIILIAVGSRSEYPHIPGVYLGISIDDLFSLDKAPGKTLIIGDGYISAEIAGILNGLGYETCILCMKPEPFTELDSNMAFKIMNELRSRGVKFYIGSNVDQIEQSTNDNTLTVVWYKHTERYEDEFDTVLFSMGRTPYTADLGLQKAGVELAADGKKIFAVNEQTNVPHIYAIGDVLYGKPELSSVANKAGQLLARKLFAGITITDQINYDLIPVTVLTPVEYSYVGLSEDLALERYGADEIEVYHSFYYPHVNKVAQKDSMNCYIKVVVMREGDQKVVGMHYMGANAGEIMQGFVSAMMCGLTWKTLKKTIHVHPTDAAEFIKMSVTKRSMQDPNPGACCS